MNIRICGRNYHSRKEWLSVQDMAAACRVVLGACEALGVRKTKP